MPSRKAGAALVFVLLIASCAAALSANETALLFAEPEEKNQSSLVPFESGGNEYCLLKIAGEETTVVRQTEDGGVVVSDAQELVPILQDYREASMKTLSPSSIKEINESIWKIGAALWYCSEPMEGFLDNQILLWYITNIDDIINQTQAARVQTTKKTIARLGGNETATGTHFALQKELDTGAEIAASLSPDEDAEATDVKLGSLAKKLSDAKSLADQYAFDYNFLKKRHPEMLWKRNCNFSSSLFEEAEKLLRSNGLTSGVERIADLVSNRTREREKDALFRRAGAELNEKHSRLIALYGEAAQGLKPYGAEPVALKRKMALLNSTLEETLFATDERQLEMRKKEYEQLYGRAYSEANRLVAGGILREINQSTRAMREAQTLTKQRLSKVGENSTEGKQISASFQELQTEYSEAIFWTQYGTGRVGAETFRNITAKVTAYTAEPKQQDAINPELVAGALAVIATLGGIAYFFSRKKYQKWK